QERCDARDQRPGRERDGRHRDHTTGMRRDYAVRISSISSAIGWRTLRAPGKYSVRRSHGTPRVRRILRLVAWRQGRPFSIAWIVRAETPALSARSFWVHPIACRAARLRVMTLHARPLGGDRMG